MPPSDIPWIDRDDTKTWGKVDAYLKSRAYTAQDVEFDFSSCNFLEDGLYIVGLVSLVVPLDVYHDGTPINSDKEVNVTHDDFVKAERTARKAFGTAKQFANPEISAELALAEHILAEVRFAAQFLCDPDSPHHQDATKRLVELFQTKEN